MLAGSLLHQLAVSHQSETSAKLSFNFGVYYKNTLVSLCHALEDCILKCSSQPLVITAFQRGKWYLEEADRYAELADRSHQVVIMATPDAGFGEHPTSQKVNVTLVGLSPGDPIAQEWHLIILAPTYTAMVLCQELSDDDYRIAGRPTADRERKFYGFWTFEAGLVRETVDLAIAHIGKYDPTLQAQLQAIVSTITDAAQMTETDDIYTAVSLVIDYLQHGQSNLRQIQPTHPNHPQEALDTNLLSNELQAFLRLAQLIDQADLSNPNAAAEVATLAEAMAQLLDLPVWQVNRLRLAGLLHRLAFLQRTDSVLHSSGFARYSEETLDAPPSCPIVPGAQILRTMQRLKAIATIITHQTERWDGTGYPAHLAGDEIPLESRILGLVTEFQQQLAKARTQMPTEAPADALGQALAACQTEQANCWDPKLVEALALLVSGLKQGFSLPISVPKIAAGMWLLDSHSEEDLLKVSAASPGFTPRP